MIDNEICVLGSMLVEPSCFNDVVGVVSAEHFSMQEHRAIFDIIRTMKRDAKPIDPVTVASEITGQLDKCGGRKYIFDLVDRVPSALHVSHYAAKVRESYRLRRVSQLAEMLAKSPGDEATSKKLRDAILDTGLNGPASMDMPQAITQYQAEIDRRVIGAEPIYPTGFKKIDAMCAGGLRGGQLVTIGARTSRGKSAMLLQIAISIARRGGRVLFHSQEMAISEILDRMVALESSLSVGRVRRSERSDVPEIVGTFGKIHNLPIRWGNQKSFGLDSFLADVEKERPDVLIVDYLQRAPISPRENRAAMFSDIANGLKNIALQNKTVVITASQLSRNVELRDDHTPTLADLKESGGIEEASDIVILVHTPDEDIASGTRAGHLIVAKNRNGATLPVPVNFEMAKTRFVEL